MRLTVFLLLLANLLFFVWTRGYLGMPANPDARRIENQLRAEQVQVASRGEPPRTANREAEKVVENKVPESCQLWSELANADADQVEQLLAEQFAAFKVTRSKTAETSGYWVFIPPLASREEANRKVAELEQLGISDLFVLPGAGPNQLAISLGTYRSEAAANTRLEALRAKGVKSARIGERKGKELNALEIRGPETQAEALRQALAARLPKAGATECRSTP